VTPGAQDDIAGIRVGRDPDDGDYSCHEEAGDEEGASAASERQETRFDDLEDVSTEARCR
jgi:hypothetical protein